MARYTYAIMSTAQPGREDEFQAWYRDQHLPDLARMPGIVGARLIVPTYQVAGGLGVPTFTALALYEIESEDPKATIDAIFAKAGTEAMPMTDAFDMTGLFQFVGQETRAIG